MHYSFQPEGEDFNPRLIVWQVTPDEPEGGSNGHGRQRAPLMQNERLLIIEGIAKAAKPIVVLIGKHLPGHPGVHELVEYGIALGLKMIIEAVPEDFTDETVRMYSSFGPKIFRIMIDHAVAPGDETRFAETAEYRRLDETVKMLRNHSFEIHLSMAIAHPDIRQLAFQHDYAFRKSANGFYGHLAIGEEAVTPESRSSNEDEIDRYIDAVGNLKQFSPKNMYHLSPQCVKYGYRHVGDDPPPGLEGDEHGVTREWRHWCLGGRTYAFITADGIVRLCSQLPIEGGDLREAEYDFRRIWEHSETFRMLRDGIHTCSETREKLSDLTEMPPHGSLPSRGKCSKTP